MSNATKKLRRAVFRRADGCCECGCGRFISEETGRLDHAFGRAKAAQSISNTWALAIPCDEARTANCPTAALWLHRFIAHADRHGYEIESNRAASKVAALHAKGMAT